jgi:hypothetical protein
MGDVGIVKLDDNPSQSVKQSHNESKKHWLAQRFSHGEKRCTSVDEGLIKTLGTGKYSYPGVSCNLKCWQCAVLSNYLLNYWFNNLMITLVSVGVA